MRYAIVHDNNYLPHSTFVESLEIDDISIIPLLSMYNNYLIPFSYHLFRI